MSRQDTYGIKWVLYSEEFKTPMYIDQKGVATDKLDEAEIYDERDNRQIKERHFTAIAGYAWRAVDLTELQKVNHGS